MPEPPTPTWAQEIDAWMAHLADEECSDHTIRSYRDDLHQFARWYGAARDLAPELGALTRRDLVEWRQAVEAAGGRGGGRSSPATVNRKLSAVKSFFAWARRQDRGVRFEPPRPARRQSRPEPKWLSREEERALMAAAEVASKSRDVAILWLGLHGGLRVAEAQALDAADVRIGERKGTLIVRKGKGSKERQIALSKTLRHALLDHLGSRRRGPVFCGPGGEALSISSLQKIAIGYARVARVGRSVGIKGFSHHCLRHTCARRMVEAGVPVPDIAAFLGHSNVNTTMVYLRSKDEDLARAAEALDGPE